MDVYPTLTYRNVEAARLLRSSPRGEPVEFWNSKAEALADASSGLLVHRARGRRRD